MASTVSVLLLLFAGIFTATVADDDCQSYFSSSGTWKPPIDCGFLSFCCGTCNDRYCCSNPLMMLSEDKQEDCIFQDSTYIAVGVTVAGLVILIVMFIVCCVCPCCCIYKMCRKPRPVIGTTTTTTVVSTQYPPQPVVQGSQYPPYQPIKPPQFGYSGAPGPYQGPPYVAGPPPPYQEAGGPGYPASYSQAAYDGGQAAYPIQPPAQPGFVQLPPLTNYSSTQPAYNPAYVEPPKTAY
ncbi:protein shisa-5-like [Pimephales promelas]|uniref:protein shisa-5-like n=1 Tax=Pimephales promelas TaxID=90988 RepID=UPI001955B48C|nr:protein shisa-5-like [Pimephales promelas]KAG1941133.1 protein shisa-4 [Pimephales promelas]